MPSPPCASPPAPRAPRRRSALLLLLVAAILPLAIPLYAHEEPKLGAFPFFIWFQGVLVVVTVVAIAAAYRIERNARHRQP